MKTPFKKAVVFDFETGGFDAKVNSVTEIAMVAVDLETLEIVDEMALLLKPRLDLRYFKDMEAKKALKYIFKKISYKNADEGRTVLSYAGKNHSLKMIDDIVGDFENFMKYIKDKNFILEYEDILEALEEESVKDMADLMYDLVYTKGAAEVSKISRELLVKEGLTYEEFFDKITEFFDAHKVGGDKPILSGHNIEKFDMPFFFKIFEDFRKKISSYIADLRIDTLDYAKLQFFDVPSRSLGAVAKLLGFTLKEAHRALPDTIANAKVLIEMIKNLRGDGNVEKEYVRKKFNFNIEL
ncbi:hypothetical protein [Tenacibaculum phage Larrie]|nr:hypothetical protein [Tenacibaculum phage Larrie]